MIDYVRETQTVPGLGKINPDFKKIESAIRRSQKRLKDIYEERAAYSRKHFNEVIASERDQLADEIFSVLGFSGEISNDCSKNLFKKFIRKPVWVKNKKLIKSELKKDLEEAPPKLHELLNAIIRNSPLETLKSLLREAREENEELKYQKHLNKCAKNGEEPEEKASYLDSLFFELGYDLPSYMAMKFISAYSKNENCPALGMIRMLVSDPEDVGDHIVTAFKMNNRPAFSRIYEVSNEIHDRFDREAADDGVAGDVESDSEDE